MRKFTFGQTRVYFIRIKTINRRIKNHQFIEHGRGIYFRRFEFVFYFPPGKAVSDKLKP